MWQKSGISENPKEQRTTSDCIVGSNSGIAVVTLLGNRVSSPVLCVWGKFGGWGARGWASAPRNAAPLLRRPRALGCLERTRCCVAPSGRLPHVSEQGHTGARAPGTGLGQRRALGCSGQLSCLGSALEAQGLGSSPHCAGWQAASPAEPPKWGLSGHLPGPMWDGS